MKKEQRAVYLELASEMDAALCSFCRYGEAYGFENLCDAGEGYHVCVHPVENLSRANMYEEDVEPGTDCYGFNPKMNIELFLDFVELILSNQFTEWIYIVEDYGYVIQSGRKEDGKMKYYRTVIPG